jgi:hypothetical protein
LPVDTIENTTSRPARSAALLTILAPRLASGSALAAVRFQTVTSLPASSSSSAIGNPMRPAPIQPMRGAFPAMLSSSVRVGVSAQ